MFSSLKRLSLSAVLCMGCASLPTGIPGWPSNSTGETAESSEFESSFSVARAYETQGNYRPAGDIYEKLIADDPQNHRLHHRLGVLEVRQGRLKEAQAHFDQALKAAPEDAELLTDIGYALYLQGKYDDAEQRLKSVIAMDPDNKRASNNLGMVLAKTGRNSEAYRAFRKTSSDAEAHSNLAYAYANNGQIDLAEQHYSRALDYDDTLSQASDALMQLDEVRRDLEAGAVLQAAAPMAPNPEQLNGLKDRVPQPMDNPDSAEFASKWGRSAVGRTSAASRPEDFQFRDDFYESTSSGVKQAVHEEQQGTPESSGHPGIRPKLKLRNSNP